MSDLARTLTSTGAIPPGTRIGKYEVLRRLGGGGMAEIYVARSHEAAGVVQWAVIKRILPHLARDPEFLRMFLNEAKITASLDHPNIAHVKEVGRAGEEFFLALELVHGVDLRRILRESASARGLPLAPALTIVRSVADALHYAHERGIVHRDVTPSNVMVTWEGHAKVLDFGIAKAALTALTRTGTIKGKVGYMSPEQCMAEDVDRRADVFALGILLWELTLGRRLYKGDSDFAIMNQISLGRTTAPSSVDPSYPPALEGIVMQALALRPADRFQTAQALASALEDFAHDNDIRLSTQEVAASMRALLGEPPPHPTAAELEPIVVQGPVVAATWSIPGRTKKGRMAAIGLLGAALGIAIGAVATGYPARSEAVAPDRVAPTIEPATAATAAPQPVAPTEAIASPSAPPEPAHDERVATIPAATATATAEPVSPAKPVAAPRTDKRRKPKAKRKATGENGSSLLPPSRRGAGR